MATATETETVTFISRFSDYRQVIEAGDVEVNHRGRVIKRIPGKSVQFEDGKLETDDPEVIDYIRGLPHSKADLAFNVDIWELGNAPDEPKPTVSEQTAAIARAAATRDVAAIEEVVKVEQETHNRDAVLATAKGALEGLAEGDEEKAPSPSQNSEQSSPAESQG